MLSMSYFGFGIINLLSPPLSSQHYLEHDQKLKKFVPIIKDSVVYPVLYDAKRTVLSLPPIINGAHSAVRARGSPAKMQASLRSLRLAPISCGMKPENPELIIKLMNSQTFPCKGYPPSRPSPPPSTDHLGHARHFHRVHCHRPHQGQGCAQHCLLHVLRVLRGAVRGGARAGHRRFWEGAM